MRRMLVVVGALVAMVPTSVMGQGLEAPTVAGCFVGPAFEGRTVRVALVEYPDGARAVAVGPSQPPVGAEAIDAARRCVEQALPGRGVSRERRRASVTTRTFTVPDRREEVLGRFLEPRRPQVQSCLDGLPRGGRLEVRVRVRVEERAVVESLTSSGGGDADAIESARRCLSRLVGSLALGGEPATFEHRLTLPRRPVPRSDGTRGAVCAWGNVVGESRPEPSPCRRGLTCCGGGSPAVERRCHPVGTCPQNLP